CGRSPTSGSAKSSVATTPHDDSARAVVVCEARPKGSAVKRAPEPELLNDEEHARAYSEADFAEPHGQFVGCFRQRVPDLVVGGAVLDLGCGPADVTARFARSFPLCHIDGVDGAESMLSYGRARVLREGLEGRVHLARVYLPHEAPPR